MENAKSDVTLNVKENPKLKILWNSNAVHAPTGYGVQTGNVCFRLLKNYDVRVAANYGLEGAALGFNGLVQYPRLFSEFGEDTLSLVIQNWKPDVFVTLYDVWVGGLQSRSLGEKDWFSKLHPRWIPWVPVDSYPIADPVADQCRLAYKVVAMSKYGQAQLKNVGVPSVLIPHGVEAEVFKPQDKAVAKDWLEKHSCPFTPQDTVKITPETFVVGVNAANKDPYRKDWQRMFAAYQIFLDQNPDAKKDSVMHVHTWLDFPGGFNLRHLARKLGISQNLKSTFTYDMLCSLPPERMSDLYNAFDVYLNLCRGGGFEVGHIESAACGVPSVGVDYTAMTELVAGHGWLVPLFAGDVKCPKCSEHFSYNGGAAQFNHLMGLYGIPDEYKAADALSDAYNHPEKAAAYGKASREFALGYDFDKVVVPLWEDLLGEVASELGMCGKAESKAAAFDKLFAEAIA